MNGVHLTLPSNGNPKMKKNIFFSIYIKKRTRTVDIDAIGMLQRATPWSTFLLRTLPIAHLVDRAAQQNLDAATSAERWEEIPLSRISNVMCALRA